MALLALAFGAQAAHVSQDEAAGAASVWAGSGDRLGVRLGADVESVREFSVTNGYSFYAVKLGGGTVIMTSDTSFEPVVAFSPRGDLDLSAGSPLYELLHKDVASRVAIAEMEESEAAQTSGGGRIRAAAAPEKPATALWGALLSRVQPSAPSGGRIRAAASADPVDSVSDVRVAPLVKSQWRQDFATTNPVPLNCYNYYTPSNYVCGCTATAMSQIMRYFEWPKAAMEPRTYECKVDKKTVELTTQGGVYDWDNMTRIPELAALFDMMADVNCQAIGKLTSDAGIAVKSSYSDGDTGADPQDVAAAFRQAFGYPDAICYWNAAGWNTGKGGLHTRPLRERVIYTNLDAGQPVQLAIYGYDPNNNWAGHAVVADGYGYMTLAGVETAFVHVNMGWAGTDDMWYNLPEINAAKSGAHVGDVGLRFLFLGGAVFNISTNDTGLSILSGRTVTNGVAVAGVKVLVFDADGATVGETVSDEHGIYFFKLAGDADYSLKALSPDGLKVGEIASLTLPATTGLDDRYIVTDSSKVGNSWGNDLELGDPPVRIVAGGETNLYTILDTAIFGARVIASSLGAPPEIELLGDADLNGSAVIDFSCVIRAGAGFEAVASVARPSDAAITVASGASLVVSNCAFEATHSTPLAVAAGGRLFIGPGFSANRVDTADAGGLNVLGAVPCDISVFCAAAMEPGLVFGHAETDDPAALSNSVERLTTKFYETGEAHGSLEEVSPGIYDLVWTPAQVPMGAAAGYFVTADGTTNTSDRVDILLGRYELALESGLLGASPEIVIVGRDAKGMSRDIVVAIPLTIRGTGSAFLEPSAAAHIVVTNGGSLLVKDLAIGDRTGDSCFRVLQGGMMTLGYGAVLTNLVCTGNADNAEPGPVAVYGGGLLRLEPGSMIVGCAAKGSSGGGRQGGGVYLAGGAVLDLAGGTITNCCSVNNYGGGVYVTTGATVVVSGPSIVAGNVNKNGKADDVYFNYGAGFTNRVCVTNSAAGGSIGVRYSSTDGNAAGFVFAETSFAVPPNAVATNSAAAFFSDASASRRGAPVDNGGVCDFEWRNDVEAADAHGGDVVRVEYPGGMTQDFDHLQYALESLNGVSGSAKVTLLKDDTFDTDLVISCEVDFHSKAGVTRRLRRRRGASITVGRGASLSVSNVVVSGAATTGAKAPLFNVAGGELKLQDGAGVSAVLSDECFAAAVVVTDGGTFTMLDGASIASCTNLYQRANDRTAYTAGLLVNGAGSTASLAGGVITNCVAYRTGGAYAGNGGKICVSGGTMVVGNTSTDGEAANMSVAADSSLVLSDAFTGEIGVRRDISADRAVFGRIDEGFSGSAAASAVKFTSDDGWGSGVAVKTNGAAVATHLAWSERLLVDGTYTNQYGVAYEQVADGSVPYPVLVPAEPDFVYNGKEQIGYRQHRGYTLSGVLSATGAGTYAVTATLLPGYEWNDGTSGAKALTWTIRKATYDMSGVTFEGATFTYDGTAKSIFISGELPDGVSVNYFDNDQTAPGAYTVTAAFTGDYDNYEAIPFMTATLTIAGGSPSVLPDLPPGAGAAEVAAALAAAGLADDAVGDAINGASDPVALYDAFKAWASGVDGGEAAVAASDRAWVSYEFGVDELFENAPSVSFTSMAIENPALASMNVKLVVKDGDAEKVVDPASVAKLFEMSADLVTWTDDLTAVPNADGSYTVKPNDPSLAAAFIRLKY